MKVLQTFRNALQSTPGDGDGQRNDEGGAFSSEELTDRFARLDERRAVHGLQGRSQVDLTTLEAFERSNGNRAAVLNKLRYLRGPEPLAGYDALDPAGLGAALSDADPNMLQVIRGYERKHAHRPEALAEIARAMATR